MVTLEYLLYRNSVLEFTRKHSKKKKKDLFNNMNKFTKLVLSERNQTQLRTHYDSIYIKQKDSQNQSMMLNVRSVHI